MMGLIHDTLEEERQSKRERDEGRWPSARYERIAQGLLGRFQ